MKKVTVFMLAAILSCGLFALPVFAEDTINGKDAVIETEKVTYRATGKGDAMLFDLVFLRPVGIASVALGFAGTVVALPFSIIANNTREVGDAMLGETMNYTFVRPLGDNYQPTSILDQK